ncbi:Uncharacterized protein dnm_075580 [Desulfonema magnum]|uniref:Uncharacterized protein n=1 Tax=Desulfonema magnum TaxID=45655 RepID=A0A975BTM9_9BACT|nr:Uncharacterized protein dnm_075580 [Desulfonema magnum]
MPRTAPGGLTNPPEMPGICQSRASFSEYFPSADILLFVSPDLAAVHGIAKKEPDVCLGKVPKN